LVGDQSRLRAKVVESKFTEVLAVTMSGEKRPAPEGFGTSHQLVVKRNKAGEVKELVGDQSRLRAKVVESKSSGREAAGRTIIPPGTQSAHRRAQVGLSFFPQLLAQNFCSPLLSP
jgi:hypothetical protein